MNFRIMEEVLSPGIQNLANERMQILDKCDPGRENDTVEPVRAREPGMTAWGHPIVEVDLASFQNIATPQSTTPSLVNGAALTEENLLTISQSSRLTQLVALTREAFRRCLASLGIRGSVPSASSKGPHTGNAHPDMVGAYARTDDRERERF